MAMQLGASVDGSSNLTSQLLLPLSADIAHIFRGAGLEGARGAQAEPPQGAQGRSAGGPPFRTSLVPPPQVRRGASALRAAFM